MIPLKYITEIDTYIASNHKDDPRYITMYRRGDKLPKIRKGTISLSCIDLDLCALPTLPNSLQLLSCVGNKITKLPEHLSDELRYLLVHANKITCLPLLPPNLQVLCCSINPLTQLPSPLPPTLRVLACNHTNITHLPDPLPPKLDTLLCYDCRDLTALPPLPTTLTTLNVINTGITHLPNPLPRGLTHLYCNDVLQTLPDLPDTLQKFYYMNNKSLRKKYPDLFGTNANLFSNDVYGNDVYIANAASWCVTYVNEQNSRMRIQARARQINQNMVLLEIYMKQKMNPTLFMTDLLHNPEIDVSEYMDTYIESL